MLCLMVKMDLVPGGGFAALMAEEGGAFQLHVEGCFLDVVPCGRVVFIPVLKEGWQPCDARLAMPSIVTMEDAGAETPDKPPKALCVGKSGRKSRCRLHGRVLRTNWALAKPGRFSQRNSFDLTVF